MSALLHWFQPWYPSFPMAVFLLGGALLYLRGSLRRRTSWWKQMWFWLGWSLIYLGLQTQWDYYAEHQFFIHMLQQMALHDLGPLLVMFAWPVPTWRAGIGAGVHNRWLVPLMRWAPMRGMTNFMLNAWVAAAMFSGLVVFWLVPVIHVGVMLNTPLYQFMNWSMVFDGLLFWWLMLDPRPAPPAHLRPGLRIVLPILAMIPQMVLGAVLALNSTDWYPIYSLCGRALSGISPLTDQHLGGLILWIPASGLNVVAAMVALRNWMRLSDRQRLPPSRRQVQAQRHAAHSRAVG